MNKKTIAYVEPAAYFTKEAMEIWEKHWAEEEKKAAEEEKRKKMVEGEDY